MPEPAGTPVRLADSALHVAPQRDDAGGPDEIVPGFGNTMRDGLGVRAERGGVEVAIVGGLIVDPLLGVLRASIGVRDGRVVAVGRAGNPDTMDDIDVVLDVTTAVLDATGLIVTPGAIDTHVHWLSPQVTDALLAGGVTTMVSQDYGPIWNLGTNPESGLGAAWAALQDAPLNAALLVRGSSSRAAPVEAGLRAGGAGLKIHEDVGAGPAQIRTALDVCDRHDVQLAIHTDGLNEVLSVQGTLDAFAGRAVHAFHVEGAGGGHAPNLLALAGRSNVLTSSTTPTVPFGRDTAAEHLAMVAAVHVLDPGAVAGDGVAARTRVRPATMAAEGVLHDLGIIHMLSSDSQGMGRAGEVVRRALQNADVMKRLRGDAGYPADPGGADNARVLRHLAKVTINPAIVHGLAHDVGALTPGRIADCVLWRPELFAVRPELVVKMGVSVWGASGDPDATTMLCEPVVVRRQVGAHGDAPSRLSLAFVSAAGADADLPSTRPRSVVRGCRAVTAADMVRNDRRAEVTVSPDGREVRVDGEVVGIEPVEEVAMSWRYLLG
ncbi:urease subunit alpha [Baekduia soli]|uniref:Urease subunit alpha n=1 Tax=Baekduia soli TaxID=496014 RepID=A0A5B8U5F3_9ACTN|nr:urease subunit alpha [Baekduia soli]QEC48068.1 urease subunit alpha [Baekduia soli]